MLGVEFEKILSKLSRDISPDYCALHYWPMTNKLRCFVEDARAVTGVEFQENPSN
jgi:hypothetical protein